MNVPMYAYADPPYVGQAKKHYGEPETDHARLIAWLVDNFPDGWALSGTSPSLRYLLTLCPPDVRVAAWVKPDAFSHWIIDLLGVSEGGIVIDVFPGSGAFSAVAESRGLIVRPGGFV